MTPLPNINSLWLFYGSPGYGETHKVVCHIEYAHQYWEIITIGFNKGGVPCHSWLGSAHDFKQSFKYLGETA